MPKASGEAKRWKEFERALGKAIAKDRAMTKKERQAWLDTLAEHVPPPTGAGVKVIFFERKRRPGRNLKSG